MTPDIGRVRFNMLLAVGEVAVISLGFELIGLLSGRTTSVIGIAGGLVGAVIFLGFLALIPATLYVLVLELLASNFRRKRLIAVVLAPLIVLALLGFTQIPGHSANATDLVFQTLFLVIVSAAYGAIVRLPPSHPMPADK